MNYKLVLPIVCGFTWLSSTTVHGASPKSVNPQLEREVTHWNVSGLRSSAFGMTATNRPLICVTGQDELDLDTQKTRVLLIGGFNGVGDSCDAVLSAMRWFQSLPKNEARRNRFSVAAIPCVRPDVVDNLTKENEADDLQFPPTGRAYGDVKTRSSHYIWRWIGQYAPDLVVDVRHGERVAWHVPPNEMKALQRLSQSLPNVTTNSSQSTLASSLVRFAPCKTAVIPAISLSLPNRETPFMAELLTSLDKSNFRHPSAARRVLQERLKRSPIEVAQQLAEHYGHELHSVVYIPALALMGRIRLDELQGTTENLEDVQQIASDLLTGERLSKIRSGSHLSGRLIFCELAERSKGKTRSRCLKLAREAADLAFDESGQLQSTMPFHNEMSDAVFMGGPILARVGRLADDARYFDACVQHTRAIAKMLIRDDGLYQHSPLCDAAWGRGNGFPALGLAMCLTYLPNDHPKREQMLASFRDHIASLSKFQDATGMWHQVIDQPQSYRELTCTCMITFAMARGVRHGWLDAGEFQPRIKLAWEAIKTRVASSGELVDVCTGTGKQRTLDDYFKRTAILGKDPRGGAMALLAATEMALLVHSKRVQ